MPHPFAGLRSTAAFSNSRAYLRPAGQTPIGAPFQGPTVDESVGQGDQKFQLITLPFPQFDILDPDGVTVINPASVPANRSGTVKQWMDPDLATACFAQARTFMNSAVSIANGSDRSQDAVGANALKSAMWWIMMGYNALNIPWYMDPDARKLFRQFVAGPPEMHGGITATAEWGPNLSYNTQWFVPQHIEPGLSQSVISQQMQALIRSVPELNDPQTQQVPTLWPMTAVPENLGGTAPRVKNAWDVNVTIGGGGGAINPSDPTYAPQIENFFVWSGFQDEQDYALVSPPVDCGGPSLSITEPASPATLARLQALQASNPASSQAGPSNCQTRDWQHPSGPNIDNDHPLAGVTNGSWRTFGWQNNAFNPKLISTPLVFYVPWVDAWASSVTGRAIDDIVTSSRLYTAYTNVSKADQSGGATAFISQVTNLGSILAQQETTGSEQTDLQVAAAAVGAIGAGLAVATYGISALIGGAVALGLTVAGASVKNSPQIARDDLGRFKPIIDRGWLAGDPSISGNNGKPPISITAPPGWVRPMPTAVTGVIGPNAWLPWTGPSSAPARTNQTAPVGYTIDANGNIVPLPNNAWMWWTLGAIVVVGAGTVGYLVLTAPKAPAALSASTASTSATRNNPRGKRRR